jgi:tRNA(Ile)-lysidine synthase
MELRDNVKALIDEYSLIPANALVVLGLSGGPDSVCLFYILNDLKKELGFELVCAHVNHGLRGEESDADELYVQNLCIENKVPLEVLVLEAGELSEKKGVTVEEAARLVRYNFFEDQISRYIKDGMAPIIAVAHNSGDNAETVLLRILRGTGVDGLSGIPLRRKTESSTTIIRPLLLTARNEIDEYLDALGVIPKIDSTNLEADYGRNKIRLNVLPLLDNEFGYQPGTTSKQLGRLASNAATDKDYFDMLTDEILKTHFVFDGGLRVGARNDILDGRSDSLDGRNGVGRGISAKVDVDFLVSLHPAVRHRLIVKAFSLIGLKQDIEAVHIAAVENLLENSGTGKSASLPHGFSFAISYDDAVFLAPAEDAAPAGDFEVSLDEIAALGEGDAVSYLGFSFALRRGEPPRPHSGTSCGAHTVSPSTEENFSLDFDELKKMASVLVLRPRRGGDRIAPSGMSGTKKLQDLFTDMKIDRQERGRLLLVCTPTEVLWVPGKRKSRSFAPGGETRSLLTISLV